MPWGQPEKAKKKKKKNHQGKETNVQRLQTLGFKLYDILEKVKLQRQ